MQVLVLAGGLGTRMRPHTETMPKALLPVAGRPFAERQVELLAEHGVDDIVFAVAYLGHMIRETLGDGSRWGIGIRYMDEGDERKGTGGATRPLTTRGTNSPRNRRSLMGGRNTENSGLGVRGSGLGTT